ncbi:hypothetical protein MAN88_48960 [Microcystis aeruginosa]|nr:hypothetical protein MAN88_48960 [Microcystis aeruginosa]
MLIAKVRCSQQHRTASQPLNYLEIKDQLFGEMTATDIYAQSKGGYH